MCEVLEKVTSQQRIKPSAILDDFEVIKDTCELFRIKPRLIPNPNKPKSEEKIVDRDIYPRQV